MRSDFLVLFLFIKTLILPSISSFMKMNSDRKKFTIFSFHRKQSIRNALGDLTRLPAVLPLTGNERN